MSVPSSTWRQNYTSEQLRAHESIKAIRAKQKSAMEATIAKRLAEERAEKEERIQRQIDEIKQSAEREKAFDAAIKKAANFRSEIIAEHRVCSRLTLIRTVRKVAHHYDISMSDLMSLGRVRLLATARAHLCAIIAKENPGLSLAGIGRALGRDHTTVIHSIRRYNDAFRSNVRGLGGLDAPIKFQNLFRPMDGDPSLATPSSMIGLGA